MRSERCRVVVKCRPTFPQELTALGDGIDLPAPGRVAVGKQFEADRVYTPYDGSSLYQDEVQALVASLYEGINSTVFAYGASGSGKTHTVLGCNDNPGILDQITDGVFARFDQRTCTVSVSVEELYCERFTDLLAASPYTLAGDSSILGSSAGSNGGHLPRTSHHKASMLSRQAVSPKYSWQKALLTSSSEMKAVVHHVLRKRRTASTCLNNKSSRSHVIVTITLEQRKSISERKYADDDEQLRTSANSAISSGVARAGASFSSAADMGSPTQDTFELHSAQGDDCSEGGGASGVVDTYLIGKMYVVDLAGSENIKRSGAEGARQKEAGEINRSLCHLKTVIEEVYTGRRVTTYRNSKLTFRLQDALGGGNSKLLVIACISTAKTDLRETKETLLFAEMARKITNTPVVNREPKDELIHRLQLQLTELQDQLKTARQEGGKAATEEVLQQLNLVEAAYADFQEEQEGKEKQWAHTARQVQQQVVTLQHLLPNAPAQSHATQGQLGAGQGGVKQLRQELVVQQIAQHDAPQASAAITGALTAVQVDLDTLQQQCLSLQLEATEDHEAAVTAQRLVREQHQQLQQLQQQVHVLGQKYQQEHDAGAAANQEVVQLKQHCHAMDSRAQQIAVDAQQDIQQLRVICEQLQQQVAEISAQHQSTQRVLHIVEAAEQQLQSELAMAKQEICNQRHCYVQLQQESQQQALQHEKALITQAATHADAMEAAATESQHGIRALEQQLQAALGESQALQARLDEERSQHEALLAAERQRLEKQLEDSMHSSVQKLTADKLRCREFLSLQVHSVRAEALCLSQALSSPIAVAQSGVDSRLVSPVASPQAAECSASGADNPGELQTSQHSTSAPADATALNTADKAETAVAPLCETSQCSDGGSSTLSTPAGAVLGPAAQQAAVMAVAAVAFSQTAAGKALTPRRAQVSMHVEAGTSLGGAASDTPEEFPEGVCGTWNALAGGASPVTRMTPRRLSVSSSSLGSIDCSQNGSVHPVVAAASAATTAAAARLHSSQHATVQQQRRHRSRRRQLAKSFSTSSWPLAYLPKEEVDMVTAEAAFNQLRGGALTVDNLHSFLEHRMLGGQLHSNKLPDGGRKRKHELVQDMLAYHRWHLVMCRSSSNSKHGGSMHNSVDSDAAVADGLATPAMDSSCSSLGSAVWRPLGASRSSSAAPSIASPSKPESTRCSLEAPAPATTHSHREGIGRYTLQSSPTASAAGGGNTELQSPSTAQDTGRAVFGVDTAGEIPSEGHSVTHAAGQQQQQQAGRWSWLTPSRRKQHSILATLPGSQKATLQQPQAAAMRPPEVMERNTKSPLGSSRQGVQLSVQLPDCGPEGGGDARGAQDRPCTPAAAATTTTTTITPSGPRPDLVSRSLPNTPAAAKVPQSVNSLSGRIISGVTGSAVAEFSRDSPAIKAVGPAVNRQLGSNDPLRLSIDLGSVHRRGWRQVQLAKGSKR